MNQVKSSALFFGSIISLSLGACQSDLKMSQQSLRSKSYRMSAPEQVLMVGIMRQIQKRMMPVIILGKKGEIPQACIFPMNGTTRCNLYHGDEGFSSDSGCVPRENVDDILGQMDNKMMCQYLRSGKIGMSMGSDREMILRAMMMGRGGIGHKTATLIEKAFGYCMTFLCMRSVAKAIENMPVFISNVARGVGPDGSVLNRVATAAEMIAAGYQEVSPGKWTLVAVLKNKLPESVKNATVYTLYDAMPDALKEAFKLDQQSALYTMGNAASKIIGDGASRSMDFVGRACEIAGFSQEPLYYFKDGVVQKAAQKVVSGLNVAKDAIETATGTSIFSETAKSLVKDMAFEALGGAALNIAVDLAGGAIGYLFDSNCLTPGQSIVGGTAMKYVTGPGTTGEWVVDKYGLAITAAEGAGKATGTYVLKRGVYWIVRAIPIPLP